MPAVGEVELRWVRWAMEWKTEWLFPWVYGEDHDVLDAMIGWILEQMGLANRDSRTQAAAVMWFSVTFEWVLLAPLKAIGNRPIVKRFEYAQKEQDPLTIYYIFILIGVWFEMVSEKLK